MLGMTTQATGSPGGEVPVDTWATRLVIARTQRGLTREEAADKAGVNRSSWSNWETGTIPRGQVEVTRRIAEALGYDVSWLLWGGPLANPHGPTGGGKGGARTPTGPYADRRSILSPLRAILPDLLLARQDAA